MRSPILLLLICSTARAQIYSFCKDGISETNFGDNEPIDVIVAVSALFSTNPKLGRVTGLFGMYHGSLIFGQGTGESRRYWTLEFDNTATNFVSGIVPDIVSNSTSPGGASLNWHNDARYCLEEGVKWGIKHWGKRFDVVASITVDQARKAFTHFVSVVNTTSHGMRPQYELFRVVDTDFFGASKNTLVKEITCFDGVAWFLHYLKSALGVALPADFVLEGTVVSLKAHSLKRVNTDDPTEMTEMLRYWRILADVTSEDQSPLGKALDMVKYVSSDKYVYDNGAGVYYRLSGSSSWFPSVHYMEIPLVTPPSMRASESASLAIVV